jgi:hypothetical protein
VPESPVYAGAYAFGKTRRERYADEHGNTRQRMRRLPPSRMGRVDLGACYRQVEPEHRLVARGLESDWENALGELAKAEAELALREQQRPRALTDTEREQLLSIGVDLGRVWSAPTTTDRDRKQLIRCLIEDVTIDVSREQRRAQLTIRWKGGAITELAVPLPRHQPTIRTDEDTIELIRRLAAHYDDGRIAGILNRQGRRSARGERFTAIIVGGLRRYRDIPAYQRPTQPPDGELMPVYKAAERSASPRPGSFAGCKPGSSAASKAPPARPGESASTTNSAHCSSNTPRPATSRSSTRCASSASAARPCCNVSSAANSKPSTSATDSEKACEYWSHKPKPTCSTPPP